MSIQIRKPAVGNGRDSKSSMFALSLAIHVAILVVLPILLAAFRSPEEPEEIEVVFYRAEELPEPATSPPAELLPLEALEPLPPAPRAEPQPVPVPEPKPLPLPAPDLPAAPVVAKAESISTPPAPRPKPVRQVRTTGFNETPSSETVVQERSRRTRSSGFGSPEPAPAPPSSDSTLRARPRTGGFEIAAAAPDPAPPPTRNRVVSQSSFTMEIAGVEPLAATRGDGSVRTGGFGETVAVRETTRRDRRSEANPDTPVEILSKPTPVYPDAARQLKIEGEIVLRVIFVSSGEMRVLGVVKGLGHGLDEAAVEAARRIEFKPARRNGQPVDYAAVLRIVFQLA